MEQQTVEVELPDGTIIEGPTREAALIAARKRLQVAVPTTPTEAARQILPSTAQELRPYVSGAAGLATGFATGNPLAGTGAMSAVDYLLRRINKESTTQPISELIGIKPTGNEMIDAPVSIGENTLATEGLGALAAAPFKMAGRSLMEADPNSSSVISSTLGKIRDKAIALVGSKMPVGPGTVVKDSVAELQPTYSQYKGAFPGSSLIEDVFARTQKADALTNSAKLALKAGEDKASSLAGYKVTMPFADDLFGTNVTDEAVTAFRKSLQISNTKAEGAKLIASGNPVTITRPAVRNALGQISQGPQSLIVEGPIDMSNTLQTILDIKSDLAKSKISPEPDSPIFRAISDLLSGTNAQIDDKTGKLISAEPISFSDAWKTKQVANSLAYGDPLSGINATDANFIKISKALNSDMDASIPTWKQNGKQAAQLWNESKQEVEQRNNLFLPSGEKGAGIKDLLPAIGNLNTVNNPIPAMNTFVDDPKKLQRALEVSDIYAGTQRTNLRKDLQGYQFMRLLKDSWEYNDAKDPTNGQFNANKLTAAWNNYANSEQGRLLYNQNQRADISKFFSDLSNISTPIGGTGPSRYLTLRLGSGAVTLGSAVTDSLLTGAAIQKGGIEGLGIVGTAVGLHQLGKLLTNPETARLMIAMQRNGPLDMSAKMAGRFIANALRNQPASVMMQDGTEVKGKIDSQGQFKADLPTNSGQFTVK